MTTCATTSGAYRCGKSTDVNGKHDGPCEAQAREYAAQTQFVQRYGFWFDTCAVCKITTMHTTIGCVQCTTSKKAITP
jgi:hypothetical protein